MGWFWSPTASFFLSSFFSPRGYPVVPNLIRFGTTGPDVEWHLDDVCLQSPNLRFGTTRHCHAHARPWASRALRWHRPRLLWVLRPAQRGLKEPGTRGLQSSEKVVLGWVPGGSSHTEPEEVRRVGLGIFLRKGIHGDSSMYRIPPPSVCPISFGHPESPPRGYLQTPSNTSWRVL